MGAIQGGAICQVGTINLLRLTIEGYLCQQAAVRLEIFCGERELGFAFRGEMTPHGAGGGKSRF